MPSAETLTTRQFVTLVYEVAGHRREAARAAPRNPRRPGTRQPPAARGTGAAVPARGGMVVDHSKFERAFGARVTPHRDAIRATLDWFATTA